MKWTLATEKRADGFKLARRIGEEKTFPARFAPHVICDPAGKIYLKEEIEWLDTTVQSFTIEDMRNAYNSGYWHAEEGLAYTQGVTFESFIKSHYEIDIP